MKEDCNMNKGEAIKRLQYKMKRKCKGCNRPVDECWICPWMILTNVMIMEINGD